MLVLLRSLFCLLLIIPSALLETRCADTCSYLYNEIKWEMITENRDAGFTITMEPDTVTGILTAEFKTYYFWDNCSANKVYFVSSPGGNIPLTIVFYPEILVTLHGTISGVKQAGERFEFPEQMGDYFQLSDRNSDFYMVAMGNTNSGTMGLVEYNYRSEKTWAKFQNTRLRDTVRITSEGNCAVFKYISVCPDATPRLCGEPSSVVEAQLGGSYTLTCSASGAPFLAASWIHNGKLKTNSQETHMVNNATHRIVSRIEIKNFDTADKGRWTCTVFNKNLGNQVTKIYKLTTATLPSLPTTHFVANNLPWLLVCVAVATLVIVGIAVLVTKLMIFGTGRYQGKVHPAPVRMTSRHARSDVTSHRGMVVSNHETHHQFGGNQGENVESYSEEYMDNVLEEASVSEHQKVSPSPSVTLSDDDFVTHDEA